MRNLRLLTFVAFFALRALAQETTGTIAGTIRDQSGAVAPGASVIVRSAGTGAERRLTSGPDGQFVATSLPVGNYEVEVTRQGFKKAVAQGIQLSVDNRLVVDREGGGHVLAVGAGGEAAFGSRAGAAHNDAGARRDRSALILDGSGDGAGGFLC